MQYNVDFAICAIIFLCLLLFVSAGNRRMGSFQSKVYRVYLYVCFVNVCLDVLSCYTVTYYQDIPLWVNWLINTVFLTSQFWIPTLFLAYACDFARAQIVQNKLLVSWMLIPAFIGTLCVVSGYFTHLIFYFDETGYQRGPLHIFLYINAVIYAIITMVYMIANQRQIGRRRCILILTVMFVGFAPTAFQFFLSDYILSGMGTTLSIYLIYLTAENPMVYSDVISGALSRQALQTHLVEMGKRKKTEMIFGIALDNFKLVNEMYGMRGGNDAMRQFSTEIQKRFSDRDFYRFAGDIFALVQPEDADAEEVLRKLREALDGPYRIMGMEMKLSACICLVHTGDGGGDALASLEYGIRSAKSKGKGEFLEINDESQKELECRKAIEQEINRQLAEGVFEVHYQPIYDIAAGCFHSLEALARLNVPGYGYISPEEFIAIAEQNGTIVQLGMLVLEEVCRFIKEADLKAHGIDFVEVNLSMVQCMQENICESICAMLEKYDIPPEMLNLEITESVAAYSENRLKTNMEKIAEKRITFSLDDYGSGYSNISYLMGQPFTIVKIDKYLVWDAMKRGISRILLTKTIAMFKAINLRVVTEGIEDARMVEIVTGMGADYIQGYYFSKPVPKEQLIERLSEEYLAGLKK